MDIFEHYSKVQKYFLTTHHTLFPWGSIRSVVCKVKGDGRENFHFLCKLYSLMVHRNDFIFYIIFILFYLKEIYGKFES